jgi:glycopeptide antibiotics resistance protein
LKRWLPVAAWLALVGTIIGLADAGGARWLFDWVERTPGADKLGHFVLIGAMAFLLNIALRARQAGPVLLGSLLVFAIFTAEEFSQLFIPHRHFDWGDLAANVLGIALADRLARPAVRPAPRV